jgi:hypothetical protein
LPALNININIPSYNAQILKGKPAVFFVAKSEQILRKKRSFCGKKRTDFRLEFAKVLTKYDLI